jgi:hypothetical protein
MTAKKEIINSQKNLLYTQDYCLWLNQTAQLLQEKNFSKLDLENLIEEIESLGRNEKRAIESNLIIVIVHLLKWRYQPEKRSNSWKSSIREHRRRIQRLLTDSPSLKNYLPEIFDDCYLEAKKQASDETGLSLIAFPEKCPFSLAESLNEDFIA